MVKMLQKRCDVCGVEICEIKLEEIVLLAGEAQNPYMFTKNNNRDTILGNINLNSSPRKGNEI